jgi:microcystin-dependent protein
MSQPYVGEIRLFAGNFQIQGWMACSGQTLAISEYDTLFNLIGTTYGGDGVSTFQLPNLSGRFPLHQGAGYISGQTGGAASVTLTANQIPGHSHTMPALGSVGDATSPGGTILAASSEGQFAPVAGATATLNASAIGSQGQSQPHDNMIPYQAVTYLISLFGIYPSQT